MCQVCRGFALERNLVVGRTRSPEWVTHLGYEEKSLPWRRRRYKKSRMLFTRPVKRKEARSEKKWSERVGNGEQRLFQGVRCPILFQKPSRSSKGELFMLHYYSGVLELRREVPGCPCWAQPWESSIVGESTQQFTHRIIRHGCAVLMLSISIVCWMITRMGVYIQRYSTYMHTEAGRVFF